MQLIITIVGMYVKNFDIENFFASNIFRYLNRTKETNELLANRSIEDYLAEKLKCDMDMVNYIIANNPSIRNIHITKVCYL